VGGVLRVAGCIAIGGVAAACGAGTRINVPGSTPKISPNTSMNEPVRTTCATRQLRAKVSGPGGAAGNSSYTITISDRGSPCSLRGHPITLIGVYPSGRRITLKPTRLSADYVAAMTTGRPANLTRNNKTATVVLVTTVGCARAQHPPSPGAKFASLRLGIGNGELVVPFGSGPEPSDRGVWLPCGIAMSGFYASPRAR
jgi:hypothetical protein